jgi:hypothetical protein
LTVTDLIAETICGIKSELGSISNKIIIEIVRRVVVINDCRSIHRIGNNADRQRVAIGIGIVGQDIDLDWIVRIADRAVVDCYR